MNRPGNCNRRMLLAGAAAVLVSPSLRAAPRADHDFVASVDRDRVLSAAERYLREEPITITAFKPSRGKAGPNDYYSEGDYWWPDPADPDAPYVRRDGFSNPAKFVYHRNALIRLSVQMPTLAAAWRLTGNPAFAEQARRHLDAWFVAPVTRMNANLAFAQAIIGRNDGRAVGIIDTVHLAEVARATKGLPESETREATIQWFADYLEWLTTSPAGKEERNAENNHGSCWVLQAAAFADLTGHTGVTAQLRARFKDVLVPTQLATDGSQPLELGRTKPYGYCLFNLDILAATAHLLSTPGDDLWRFQTPDGRHLPAALDFMAPYIADKSRWPYPPDVENFGDWPVRHPALLFGGMALGRPDLIALWTRLDADPTVGEIIRNYPVRQPILWL